MDTRDNGEVMLEICGAIERRDQQRMFELCQPDVEFHWAPSLPHGGMSRGLAADRLAWSITWLPLEPAEAEPRQAA